MPFAIAGFSSEDDLLLAPPGLLQQLHLKAKFKPRHQVRFDVELQRLKRERFRRPTLSPRIRATSGEIAAPITAETWLRTHGLSEYAKKFRGEGFDTENDFLACAPEDAKLFADKVRMKPLHAVKFTNLIIQMQSHAGSPASGGDSTAASEGDSDRVIAERYEMREVIGQGGFGTVWLGTDTNLGRAVAIKEVKSRGGGAFTDKEKRRLIRE